jgi:outer membrane protein assembly factor BamB/pSer/pThr/pTyr-binding forkhead associated (FHA) protein
MALLEIIHLTGEIERRDLYKRQPLSIGSHTSCDLRVDEKGVERIHCRISWNKDNWEAVAAGESGVELNGVEVQRAVLKSGDTLRFGTVDVKFHGGLTADDTPKEAIGIKPTSDEAILTSKAKSAEAKKAAATAPKGPRSDEDLMQSLEMLAMDAHGTGGKAKKKAADDDIFEEIDEDHVAAPPAKVAKPAAKPAAAPAPKKPEPVAESAFEEVDEDDEEDVVPAGAGISGKIQSALGTNRRPGEVDTVRSPLVLGLLGFIALALLVTGAFYFIAGRRFADKEFEAAKALVDEGNYKSGIEALQTFVESHKDHEKAPEAELLAGLTKIDQHLKSAAPNFGDALKSIKEFISVMSDKPNFDQMKLEITSRAGTTSLGAAQLAGKNPRIGRDLIKISEDAKTLLATYSSKEAPPTEKIAAIDGAIRTSKGLMRKFEINDGITNNIKKALTDKKPMEALRLQRELLAQYPDYANERGIRALLTQTMETERSLVVADAPNTPSISTEDEASLPVPRTLTFHARSRNDGVSVNEVVWVLAKDCLYGVDTITGLPVWRRRVGIDSPFFPVEDDSKPSLICFDSDRNELLRIHRNLGALIWRQPLGVRVSGKPLLVQGQIYLTTVSGSLLQIDLETGTLSSRLTFSQPVVGPGLIEAPPGQDGEPGDSELVVVGDQDVIYTVSRRPLQCLAVSYLSQKSQSVQAPLISMGPYAAFVENHSEEKSTLHLLQRDPAKPGVVEAANGPIQGMVVDEITIRGTDLFVPSTVERISAFSVSATAGEPPLRVGPTFQVQGAKGSPIFLSPGPERQVWMSSSALRKLQLTTESIEVDQNVVAVGISSQPVQQVGNLLFNARRRPFSDGVTLNQTERNSLTSEWQLLAGARFLAVAPVAGDSPSILVVNEGGASFRVTSADLSKPGFQSESATLLPVNQETTLPLVAGALPDSQIAVACGTPEARIWVLNRLGQIEKQGTLPGNPQASPVPLGKRIIVPIEGKLHVARTGQADTIVQDFQFPTGEKPPVWKQVVAADDKTLVGLTEDGQLLQFRLESNPKPHLAQVAREDLGGPAIGRISMYQGQFAVGTSSGSLMLFDGAKFNPIGKRTLEPPCSGPSFVTEAGVLTEVGGTELRCLNADGELTDKWKLELPDSSLAGQPQVIGGQLVLAFENGTVLNVDPKSGEILKTRSAAGQLDSGPIAIGNQWGLVTWDGSLISLPVEGAQP